MTGRIAFVTYGEQSELTADDALAAARLVASAGVSVEAIPWDRADVRWNDFAAVVLRSTWDYHRRPEEFRRWLTMLESAQALVFNPTRLLRWNMEKTYLRELEAAGIAVVPTVWLPPGAKVDLPRLLGGKQWERAVIKPVISASADETWMIRRSEASTPEEKERLERLLARAGVMIQPFVEEIVTLGEWSMIFFNGEYSHAIVKRPAAGDFRVQAQYGASRRSVRAHRHLIKEARAIIDAAVSLTGEPLPLYARVDGVISGTTERFLLMELELIEPELVFASSPNEAPKRFARALAEQMRRPAANARGCP